MVMRASLQLILVFIILANALAAEPIAACGEVSSSGDYTLSGALAQTAGNCLNVTAANVSIDCAGYTIQLNDTTNTSYASAIYSNQANTTIRNCNIIGPTLSGASNGNNTYGVFINSAANPLVTNVNVTNVQYGVWFNNTDNAVASYSSGNITPIGGTSSPTAPFYVSYSRNTNITNFYGTVAGTAASYSAGFVKILSSNSTFISHGAKVRGSVSGSAYAVYMSGTGTTNLTINNITINSSSHSTLLQGKGKLSISNSDISTRGYLTIPVWIDSWAAGEGDWLFENNTLRMGGGVAYGAIYIKADTDTNRTITINNNQIISTHGVTGIAPQGIKIDSTTVSGYPRTITNNTFTGIFTSAIQITAGQNWSIYWNNFSNSGLYLNQSNDSLVNYLNTSIGGVGEGNLYGNVINGSIPAYSIPETNSSFGSGWYVANSGAGVPYNNSTSNGKIIGNVTDYAPLTTRSSGPFFEYIAALPASPAIEMLFCSANISDPDTALLNLSVSWYRNGENQTGLATAYTDYSAGTLMNVSNVSAGNVSFGQNWSCGISATDGLFSTESASSNITIIQPPIVNVSMTSVPSGFYSTSRLYANYSAQYADGAILDWRRNNVSIATLNLGMDLNTTNTSAVQMDGSTYINNATLSSSNAIWNSTCVVGGCYDFNSTSNVAVPDGPSVSCNNENFTLMFWYKLKSIVASTSPVGKSSSGNTINYNFWTIGTNLQFYVGNGTSFTSWAIESENNALNAWRHIAWTYNPANCTFSFYGNGTLVKNVTDCRYPPYDNTVPMSIGALSNGTCRLNGSVDEVKIFKRILSPAQIQAIYDSERQGIPWNSTVSEEIASGENWSVAAKAYNNSPVGIAPLYSAASLSNQEEIQVAAPAISMSIITNAEYTLNESNLTGRCTATDPKGTNVNYEWKWLKGGIEHSAGIRESQASGIAMDLANITSNETEVGETWLFACRANNSIISSEWSNVSILIHAPSTFHVSAEGNDTTGNGSAAAPWRTINYALSSLYPQDTLALANGTYLETGAINITRAITITAENANVSSTGETVFNMGGRGARVTGVTVDCSAGSATTGVSFSEPAVNSTTSNLTIRSCSIGASFGDSTSGCEIANSTFSNISSMGAAIKSGANSSRVFNNTFELTSTYGIYSDSGALAGFGSAVEGNRFAEGNGSATTVVYVAFTGGVTNNISITGNSFGTGEAPLTALNGVYFNSGANGSLVHNNTFFFNNTTDSKYAIRSASTSDYLTITNNAIGSEAAPFASPNKTSTPISIIYGIGHRISNNTVWHGYGLSAGIRVTGNAAAPTTGLEVRDNEVHNLDENNSIGYMIGIGIECCTHDHIISPQVTGNRLYSVSNGGTPNHGLFVGYTNNPYVANNYVYQGLYTYVFKGNQNGTVYNNTGAWGKLGFYDKASQNVTYQDNYFIGGSGSNYPVYISYNPTDNRSANGSVWYNTQITENGSTNSMSIGGWETVVTMINTTINGVPVSPLTNITAGTDTPEGSFAFNRMIHTGWHYRVRVLNSLDGLPAAGATVNVKDEGNATILKTFTTDSDGYMPADYLLSHTLTNASSVSNVSYVLEATYNGKSASKAVNLSGNNLSDTIYLTVGAIGNSSNISATGVSNVTVSISNTTNLSEMDFGNNTSVVFYAEGLPLIIMGYNFSVAPINFSAVNISNGSIGGKGYFSVSGINSSALAEGKTVYLYGANASYNAVCVKDIEGATADNMTQDCTGAGESLVACDGALHSGIACELNGSTAIVSHLAHSAAMQAQYSAPAATYGGGSGGVAPWLSEKFNCSDGMLEIGVRDSNGPVAGIEVRLMRTSEIGFAAARSDSAGIARFSITQNGRYSVETRQTDRYQVAWLQPFALELCEGNDTGETPRQVEPPAHEAANGTGAGNSGGNESAAPGTGTGAIGNPTGGIGLPGLDDVVAVVGQDAVGEAGKAAPAGFALAGIAAGIGIVLAAVAFYLSRMRKRRGL